MRLLSMMAKTHLDHLATDLALVVKLPSIELELNVRHCKARISNLPLLCTEHCSLCFTH